MAKQEKSAVDMLRDSVKAFVVAFGMFGVALAIILTLVLQQDHKNAADNRTQDEAQRVERAVEACHLSNRQQSSNRAFARDQIPALAVSFFGQTPEEAAKLLEDPHASLYEDFIINHFPYRNCTRDCVTAQYDPSIPDCPIAQNEEGDK